MEDKEDGPAAKMARIDDQGVDRARPDESSSDSDSSSDGDSESGDSSSSASSSSSGSSSDEDQEGEEEEEEEQSSWIEVPDAASPSELVPVVVDANVKEGGGKDSSLEQLGLDLTRNGEGVAGADGDNDDAQFHVNLDFFADSGDGPVDPVFVDDDHGHGDHAAATAEFDRLEREIDSYCKSGEASAASSPPSLGLPTEKPDCEAVSPSPLVPKSPPAPPPAAEGTPSSAPPPPPPSPPPASPPASPPPPPPPPLPKEDCLKPPPPAIPSTSRSEKPPKNSHRAPALPNGQGDIYEEFSDSDDDGSFMEEEHNLLEQEIETPTNENDREKEENPRPMSKRFVVSLKIRNHYL